MKMESMHSQNGFRWLLELPRIPGCESRLSICRVDRPGAPRWYLPVIHEGTGRDLGYVELGDDCHGYYELEVTYLDLLDKNPVDRRHLWINFLGEHPRLVTEADVAFARREKEVLGE